jgi:holo-[acyl-carrier protein] synthase
MNEVKDIIAVFLGINAENIKSDTIIDNSVLQGSVKIHMMYGDLADNGYKIADYSKIRTFGELLSELKLSDENTTSHSKELSLKEANNMPPINVASSNVKSINNNSIGLGVDILQISKLPKVDDFRESSFYSDNFSLKEFSYCLLKPNPYKSFAGKFAAKEAIVKADNNFKNIKFKEIEILNDKDGKPHFGNFAISISYEDDFAIAIATASSFNNPIIGTNTDVNVVQNESVSKIKDQIFEKVNDDLRSNYLKKSYKSLITLSLILNIVTVIYITYKVYLLF